VKLNQRDKRAFVGLGVAAAVTVVVLLWPEGNGTARAILPADPLDMAQKRLARMRQLAATAPGTEEVAKKVTAELAAREKGLIQADTAPQAQAQLLQIMRRIGKAQPQPIDIRGNEIGQVRAFADTYGEVQVSVSMDCRIDQLVNLLADITAQPELIATSDVRIGAASGREKILPVRLTVSGIVPKKLVPQKKGAGAF
jgi:hypothetical protein